MTTRTDSAAALRQDLRQDLLLALFLVGSTSAARLLPHVSNVSPVAASALFAGMMLSPALARHRRAARGDAAERRVPRRLRLADDGRGLCSAGAAGGHRHSGARPARLAGGDRPAALACSLIFFATTNFAVWAFSGLYSPDTTGLLQCYVAALPFLKYTVAGDLFWSAVLFGGAFLLRRWQERTRNSPTLASQV